jgi:hypothetical protein
MAGEAPKLAFAMQACSTGMAIERLTELPEATSSLACGVGFLLTTGLLHLCGNLIDLAQKPRVRRT